VVIEADPERFVLSVNPELRPVPRTWLDELDPGCLPRHRRLFVAGFALSKPGVNNGTADLRRAYDLYETRRPGLIDRPTRLTVASIIAELELLLG
jgi:hypothetical protein